MEPVVSLSPLSRIFASALLRLVAKHGSRGQTAKEKVGGSSNSDTKHDPGQPLQRRWALPGCSCPPPLQYRLRPKPSTLNPEP